MEHIIHVLIVSLDDDIKYYKNVPLWGIHKKPENTVILHNMYRYVRTTNDLRDVRKLMSRCAFNMYGRRDIKFDYIYLVSSTLSIHGMKDILNQLSPYLVPNGEIKAYSYNGDISLADEVDVDGCTATLSLERVVCDDTVDYGILKLNRFSMLCGKYTYVDPTPDLPIHVQDPLIEVSPDVMPPSSVYNMWYKPLNICFFISAFSLINRMTDFVQYVTRHSVYLRANVFKQNSVPAKAIHYMSLINKDRNTIVDVIKSIPNHIEFIKSIVNDVDYVPGALTDTDVVLKGVLKAFMSNATWVNPDTRFGENHPLTSFAVRGIKRNHTSSVFLTQEQVELMQSSNINLSDAQYMKKLELVRQIQDNEFRITQEDAQTYVNITIDVDQYKNSTIQSVLNIMNTKPSGSVMMAITEEPQYTIVFKRDANMYNLQYQTTEFNTGRYVIFQLSVSVFSFAEDRAMRVWHNLVCLYPEESRRSVDIIWPNTNKHYRLVGIIVHVGQESANSGHYYTYSRINETTWMKIDDHIKDYLSDSGLQIELNNNSVIPYILLYEQVYTEGYTVSENRVNISNDYYTGPADTIIDALNLESEEAVYQPSVIAPSTPPRTPVTIFKTPITITPVRRMGTHERANIMSSLSFTPIRSVPAPSVTRVTTPVKYRISPSLSIFSEHVRTPRRVLPPQPEHEFEEPAPIEPEEPEESEEEELINIHGSRPVSVSESLRPVSPVPTHERLKVLRRRLIPAREQVESVLPPSPEPPLKVLKRRAPSRAAPASPLPKPTRPTRTRRLVIGDSPEVTERPAEPTVVARPPPPPPAAPRLRMQLSRLTKGVATTRRELKK